MSFVPAATQQPSSHTGRAFSLIKHNPGSPRRAHYLPSDNYLPPASSPLIPALHPASPVEHQAWCPKKSPRGLLSSTTWVSSSHGWTSTPKFTFCNPLWKSLHSFAIGAQRRSGPAAPRSRSLQHGIAGAEPPPMVCLGCGSFSTSLTSTSRVRHDWRMRRWSSPQAQSDGDDIKQLMRTRIQTVLDPLSLSCLGAQGTAQGRQGGCERGHEASSPGHSQQCTVASEEPTRSAAPSPAPPATTRRKMSLKLACPRRAPRRTDSGSGPRAPKPRYSKGDA